MKAQSTILRRKANNGKEFTLFVREMACGQDFGWGFSDDVVFNTKAQAMKNAKLALKNMVENYNDTH